MKSEKTRYKTTKRILKYSNTYTLDDLNNLTLAELINVEEKSLIKLTIRTIFRNRHAKN